MDNKVKQLFTPFQIGKETIKNRFVVAPMGVPAYVDSNGAFTERGMQYFVEPGGAHGSQLLRPSRNLLSCRNETE